MAEHRKKRSSVLKRFSRKQLVIAASSFVAAMLLIGSGVASAQMYRSNDNGAVKQLTSYSATDKDDVDYFTAASRDQVRSAQTNLKNGRGGADASTSYVKVVVNGKSELVFGSGFTTVKSVLEQGNITLEDTDTVTPSLTSKVTEATVITINRADTTVETKTQKIAYNTITKESDSLAKGTTKVVTKGKAGEMVTTNLVQVVGGKTISTNTLASWVKKTPVNKVILVGTKTSSSASSSSGKSSSSNSSSSSSANYGTTTPVGTAQSIAHKKVLAKGWSESEFTCLVKLWQKESGWRTNAHNASSGAHGIPQALPGSKMGAGWQSDANVQISWGINYIAGRYSTPCGAWGHSQSVGWY
ncbi:MAG: G5 domain-containing protein [Bifidobacteriaceae bacterium]|nr:G5 domain-containing protein [Bifidobacteriaceae bacterium]MCI1915438.1 G5 domain-containing protein [Bifidobacteriaceae bacterium]